MTLKRPIVDTSDCADALKRANQAIDAHATCIRQLEEAEERLRTQDATYWDARIAAEYRVRFDMLARLYAFGDQHHDTEEPGTRTWRIASSAAAKGFGRIIHELLQRDRPELIKKPEPDIATLSAEADPPDLDENLERELIAEMVDVIEVQQSRIRDLESVEYRLCEQSPSFVDSRIASEQRYESRKAVSRRCDMVRQSTV